LEYTVLTENCPNLTNLNFKKSENREEIIGTAPTAQNDDSAIRSENEQELRSTTDRPTNMPMPPYPIGWSSTSSGANP